MGHGFSALFPHHIKIAHIEPTDVMRPEEGRIHLQHRAPVVGTASLRFRLRLLAGGKERGKHNATKAEE